MWHRDHDIVYNRHQNFVTRWRPYRVECTGSLSTSEVKRHRAQLVLGWGTAWEAFRVLSAFYIFYFSLSLSLWSSHELIQNTYAKKEQDHDLTLACNLCSPWHHRNHHFFKHHTLLIIWIKHMQIIESVCEMTLAHWQLEPAIFGSGGQCLIHLATGLLNSLMYTHSLGWMNVQSLCNARLNLSNLLGLYVLSFKE